MPGFFDGLERSSSSLLSIRFRRGFLFIFVPLSWWTEGNKLFELGGTRRNSDDVGVFRKKMMAVKCLQVQWSLWNLPGYETILGGLPWRQQQQQLRGSGRRMQIGRSQWSRHHSVGSSMSGGCAARAGGNVSQSDANDNAEELASSSSSSSDAWQGIISANVCCCRQSIVFFCVFQLMCCNWKPELESLMFDAYGERFLLVVFGTREGCRGEATFCVCAKVLNNF